MAKQQLTEHHGRVLLMASIAHNRVSDIHADVNPHKRFDRSNPDPYGEVIEWVHETGAWLFGPYNE
jgi:hypothetical protein